MPRKKKIKEEVAVELTPDEIIDKQRQEQLAQIGPVSKNKSLNAILGFKGTKYKTEELTAYEKQLRAMNKLDLQKECIRVGRAPIDNREIMIERLIKDFRQYVAASKSVGVQPTGAVVLSNKSREILSRGGSRVV